MDLKRLVVVLLFLLFIVTFKLYGGEMKKGDLVIIEFKDHVFTTGGNSAVLPCKVVGWLVRENAEEIVVASWVAEHDLTGVNTDTYSIFKHKNIKIKKVK